MRPSCALAVVIIAAVAMAACGSRTDVLTFSGSAVGAEGVILRRQVDRFAAAHSELPIEIRQAPDAADQRHQLYVHWLNAWARRGSSRPGAETRAPSLLRP